MESVTPDQNRPLEAASSQSGHMASGRIKSQYTGCRHTGAMASVSANWAPLRSISLPHQGVMTMGKAAAMSACVLTRP